MKHLNSSLINSYEATGYKTKFYERYGKLIEVVKESNSYKGNYHDTDHLIGTAYLIYLMTIKNNKDFNSYVDSAVIAGLFHDFCYLGEKDDRINIEHSKSMLRLTAFEHPDLIKRDDIPFIETLIGYTHYDFDNPTPTPPANSAARYSFHVMRDADQTYASLFFSEKMFDQLYEDIGKRFNYAREEFVIRNKNYVAKIREQVETDFAKTVLNEIADELASAHDKLL